MTHGLQSSKGENFKNTRVIEMGDLIRVLRRDGDSPNTIGNYPVYKSVLNLKGL